LDTSQLNTKVGPQSGGFAEGDASFQIRTNPGLPKAEPPASPGQAEGRYRH